MSGLAAELSRPDAEIAAFEELRLPPFLVEQALKPLTADSGAARLLGVLPTLPVDSVHVPQDADFEAVIVAALHEYAALCDSVRSRVGSRTELWKRANRIRYGLVPLLKTFGMWDFKRRLADRAFAAETFDFDDVCRNFAAFRERHEPLASWAQQALSKRLREAGIAADCRIVWCTVDGAWRRLKALGARSPSDRASSAHASFARARPSKFFDLYVLLPEDVENCYRALAAVHEFGAPVPGCFEDFVATPRSNGFSALVTQVSVAAPVAVVVLSSGAEIMQVVVQTKLMNEVSRYGIAHPRCYERARSRDGSRDGCRFVDALVATATKHDLPPSNLRTQDIVVYTVGGKTDRRNLWTVPGGATVLDLAFRLHTEIGRWAESAMVNGKPVSLGYALAPSDVVEISTRPSESGKCPRTESDLRLVTTKKGRLKIRHILNSDAISKARHLIKEALDRRRVVFEERAELDAAVGQVVAEFDPFLGERSVEELYRTVGEGKDSRVTPRSVAAAVARAIHQTGFDTKSLPDTPGAEWTPAVLGHAGSKLIRLRLCSWCRPVPRANTVGVAHTRYITVHRDDCTHFRGAATIPIQWKRIGRSVRSVLTLYCEDRPRLVESVCERVASRGCGLEELHATTNEFGRATLALHLYTNSVLALGDLMQNLRTLRSVREVKVTSSALTPEQKYILEQKQWPYVRRQLESGLGEHDAKSVIVTSTASAHGWRGKIVLPYNDLKPTFLPDHFFGREEEVAKLHAYIRASRGYIFITGPRRIGKTSLALRCFDRLEPDERHVIVRVNLRHDRLSTSETVLEKIADTLAIEVPGARRIDGDPRATIEAIVAESSRPILLVLDEFGAALECFERGTLGLGLFSWITTQLERQISGRLNLVLITPREGFQLLNRKPASEYLSRLAVIDLSTMSEKAAREMVMWPFARQGVTIPVALADKVVALTGRHPYFIILFLHELVNLINSGSVGFDITPTHVDECSKRILKDQRFQTAVNEPGATPLNEYCMQTLANLQQGSQYVTFDRILAYGKQHKTKFRDRAIGGALRRLVEYRLLEPAASEKAYRFNVPLVLQWFGQNRAQA